MAYSKKTSNSRKRALKKANYMDEAGYLKSKLKKKKKKSY